MAGRFLLLEGVPSVLPCPGSQLRAGGVSSLAGAHVRGAYRGRLAGGCWTSRGQGCALGRREEEAPALRGLQRKAVALPLRAGNTGWVKSDGSSMPLTTPPTLAEGKATFRWPSYPVLPRRPAGTMLATGHLDGAFWKWAGGPKRDVATMTFLLKLLRPHHWVSSWARPRLHAQWSEQLHSRSWPQKGLSEDTTKAFIYGAGLLRQPDLTASFQTHLFCWSCPSMLARGASGVLLQAASIWIAAPCSSPRPAYACQALLCVYTCKDGKLTGNYFSWKVVLTITYQKRRMPSTSHRVPTTMRAVQRKGWPAGKASPSAIIFLTHLSIKEMNASKIRDGQ